MRLEWAHVEFNASPSHSLARDYEWYQEFNLAQFIKRIWGYVSQKVILHRLPGWKSTVNTWIHSHISRYFLWYSSHLFVSNHKISLVQIKYNATLQCHVIYIIQVIPCFLVSHSQHVPICLNVELRTDRWNSKMQLWAESWRIHSERSSNLEMYEELSCNSRQKTLRLRPLLFVNVTVYKAHHTRYVKSNRTECYLCGAWVKHVLHRKQHPYGTQILQDSL